jgi:hypothetical protein
LGDAVGVCHRPSSAARPTITPRTRAWAQSRSNACWITGRPRSGRYCFGIVARMRAPLPAAGTMAQMEGSLKIKNARPNGLSDRHRAAGALMI